MNTPHDDAEGIWSYVHYHRDRFMSGIADRDEAATMFFRGGALACAGKMLQSIDCDEPLHLDFSRSKELLSMCDRARDSFVEEVR